MEPHADNDNVIRSVSVKVYQKNSDEIFILKQPLQHLVLLETTIKDPKMKVIAPVEGLLWNT